MINHFNIPLRRYRRPKTEIDKWHYRKLLILYMVQKKRYLFYSMISTLQTSSGQWLDSSGRFY